MIKKTVTYEDFDGDEVTEDLYFHLSNLELIELEQSTDGGMMQHLQNLIGAGNAADIVTEFRKLISLAYGTRGEGGRTFIKDEAVTKQFLYSPAFDALFEELVDNPESAGSFIEGMVSKKLLARVNTNREGQPVETVKAVTMTGEDDQPEWLRLGRTPTNQELMRATPEQIGKAFAQRQAANRPSE
jgi:hypothetical protein